MKKGDFVKVSFTGRLDGRLIDTTDEKVAKKEGAYENGRGYEPMVAVVGEGMVLKGLDKALETLSVGEEKTVRLKPVEAFGEREPKLIKLVPLREFLKQRVNPVPGMVLNIEGLPARVQAVSGGRVRLDFNHPLAGKEVEYTLKVVDVANTERDKITYLMEKDFKEVLKFEIAGTGAERKLVVEIPEKLRTNRALVAMKATFSAEAAKLLGFSDVEFKEVWAKKA